MSSTRSYFFDTIKILLEQGEVLLASSKLELTKEEELLVIDFLEDTYQKEEIDWPHPQVAFDQNAAIWAAKLIYRTAILTVYRDKAPESVIPFLNKYTGKIDAEAMLSANLCLRFLTDIIHELETIDQDDELISALELVIMDWPLVAVKTKLKPDAVMVPAFVLADANLKTIMTDSIIASKNLDWAMDKTWRPLVSAALGNYAQKWWPAFASQIEMSQIEK